MVKTKKKQKKTSEKTYVRVSEFRALRDNALAYRVAQQIGTFLYALTSTNIDRFSNLFHCLSQENICNNTVTKVSTTLQVSRYTTL